MYFPYLRGKQFELDALIEAPVNVYQKTLPILEPINISHPKAYEKIKARGVPFILVTNPYYPSGAALTYSQIQGLITTILSGHTPLLLGYIIDVRFSAVELNRFLQSNIGIKKALIFRNNPLPATITTIQSEISAHPVEYLVFDETKTNAFTRSSFIYHPKKVLITDGFQRQEKNILYPASSTFTSNFNGYSANGWAGIGDYLTIGDYFQSGGGSVYVVSLHVTKLYAHGLVVHHFSSTSNRTIKGLPAMKFAEANGSLVSSTEITPLTTSGIEYFRNWHFSRHNPQLGAAKKASIIHHMEIMSQLV